MKLKKTNYMYPECETTFEKDACCGSIAFNSGKFICCDGKLSKKYDHTCCGKKLINPSKYGCCNNRKYDLRLDFLNSYVIKNDTSLTSLLVICVSEKSITARKFASTNQKLNLESHRQLKIFLLSEINFKCILINLRSFAILRKKRSRP